MECSSIEPIDEEFMPGIWCCPSPLSLYLLRCSARPCKPYTAGWGAAAGKPENKRINTRSVSKLAKRIGIRIYFFMLSRVLNSFSACLDGFYAFVFLSTVLRCLDSHCSST